jgi:HlyD family secretion protein
MNIKAIATIVLPSLLMMAGCSDKDVEWDVQGQFEATEVMVASEVGGKIMEFSAEEGQSLTQNQICGYIDTMQLYLKKQQLQATIVSILTRNSGIKAQLNVIDEQIVNFRREQLRMVRLIKENAGTQKQLDDINGQIEVLIKQKEATTTNFAQFNAETAPLQSQINQLDDQIQKCIIKSPVSGTVISKYAEKGELSSFSKALFKVADLSVMTLKAYATVAQLSAVKLGQKVTVYIDTDGKKYKKLEGIITWISDKSEFTPKTIQTRNERANLVYALKIKVKNDGNIRIGMPAEVKF